MTGLLMWEKPKKAMSHEEHVVAHGSSAEAAGTYVPNMSDEDAGRWRARLAGQKKGPLRVEVRRTLNGAQIVLVVSEGNIWPHREVWVDGGEDDDGHYELRPPDRYANLKLTANGPLYATFEEWAEINAVIAEARAFLREYQSPEATEARRSAAQEARTKKELAEYERLGRKLRRRGTD